MVQKLKNWSSVYPLWFLPSSPLSNTNCVYSKKKKKKVTAHDSHAFITLECETKNRNVVMFSESGSKCGAEFRNSRRLLLDCNTSQQEDMAITACLMGSNM